MQNKDFLLCNLDTDAISFCHKDFKSMSKEEQDGLIDELNSIFPEKIKFAHDGYFDVLIILKAKNYIMYKAKGKNGKPELKLKGSALKDLKKEPILKELINEIIDSLIHDKNIETEIYKKYVKLAYTAINPTKWSKRVTITKSVLNCKDYTQADIDNKDLRKNETNVWDAVRHLHIQEGDRVELYPAIISRTEEKIPKYKKNKKTGENEISSYKTVVTEVKGLKLANEYNNDLDRIKLVARVYDTMDIFDAVLKKDEIVDYTLKKNLHLLETL